MRIVTGLVGASALLLAVPGCSRDQIAPDCFFKDDGTCIVPGADDGGGGLLTLDCGSPPNGAVKAGYTWDLAEASGSEELVFQAAGGLPAGLMVSATTGQIYGAPEEEGEFSITIQMTDTGSGRSISDTCDAITIGEELGTDLPGLPQSAPRGCLPISENILDHLIGGDGSDITCSIGDFAYDTCENDEGNGQLPAGITFDPETCMASGTVQEEHFGTHVWMVQVQQSGNEISVPFCAEKDISGMFHDINFSWMGDTHNPMDPIHITFDPAATLDVGDGQDPRIEVFHECANNECINYGFSHLLTCSPFDQPFSWDDWGTLKDNNDNQIGFFHGMQASTQGNIVQDQPNGDRPWVVKFRSWYCTTNQDNEECDPMGNNFFDNAQSAYTWSIIAWPE